MACSVNAQTQTNAQQNASDAKAGQAQLLPWETPRDTTCHEVLLETTLGNIRVALYNDTPHHRDNFLKLVNSGYYNGCIFQRVIKNFMIQGGDPNGDGTGGSKQTIKGEFTANGVDNPLKHTRGVISMARSQSNDSASSQFFIMHEDTPSLDGEYAAFGCAYSGMDIVDKICDDVKTEDSNGTVSKKNQPVIESITCTKIQ